MDKEILLPKISDNIEVVTVTEVLVEVGDVVEEEDSLITVESEKASLEVPTEYAGTIVEVLVKEGDEIKIGSKIIIIETDGDDDSKGQEDKAQEEEKEDASDPKGSPAKEKNKKVAQPEPQSAEESPQQDDPATSAPQETHSTDKDIPVSPLARKIAREMNVNLKALADQSEKPRITVDDVKAFASKQTAGPATETSTVKTAVVGVPDFNQWGSITREKMSSIRKVTAKNTSYSWQTMPHVTQFDEADITDLEAFRKSYNAKHQTGLTITAILLKVIGLALKEFPKFNASLDYENQEIIHKHYFHIGVAADTKDGLLMPVIQDVDQKGILQMSDELGEKAEMARERKLKPEDMSGQTFVISNLGGIGGTNFTPVVFPNNSSILGVSRASIKPVYDKATESFKPRLMAPLCVSYDHRVIDGAEAARFMRWVCKGLEQPIQLLF